MSKYRMFKNYMYNDLNITKEDIREWTREAVKEVALNFMQNHISEWEINGLMTKSRQKVMTDVTAQILANILKKDNYEIQLIKK